jgi:hypothetical protein
VSPLRAVGGRGLLAGAAGGLARRFEGFEVFATNHEVAADLFSRQTASIHVPPERLTTHANLVGSDRDQHVVLHAAKSTQLTTTVIDYHGCMPCVVMVQCNRGHVFIQEVPCLSTPTADVDARLRQRIPSERSGHVRFASSRCLRPMHGCTLALGSFTRNATTGRPCHQGDLSRKRIASPLSKKNDSTKEAPSTIRRDVPRGSDRRSSSTGELHRGHD